MNCNSQCFLRFGKHVQVMILLLITLPAQGGWRGETGRHPKQRHSRPARPARSQVNAGQAGRSGEALTPAAERHVQDGELAGDGDGRGEGGRVRALGHHQHHQLLPHQQRGRSLATTFRGASPFCFQSSVLWNVSTTTRCRTLSVVTLASRFFTIFSTYWAAASARSSIYFFATIRFDSSQPEAKDKYVIVFSSQGEGGVEETIHPFGFCYNPRLGKWTTTGLLIITPERQ